MIPQVTAAALVSENKSLAFPASVDSIPTSAGQEDHVSMAPIAARKAAQIARNAAGVIAVELMAAARGHRLSRAAQDFAQAAGGPRRGARAFAALHRRPLLGRRNGRASGGGAGRRIRRRRNRARSLARQAVGAGPHLRAAEDADDAARELHLPGMSGCSLADTWMLSSGIVDVARPALAARFHIGEHGGPDHFRRMGGDFALAAARRPITTLPHRHRPARRDGDDRGAAGVAPQPFDRRLRALPERPCGGPEGQERSWSKLSSSCCDIADFVAERVR